MFGTIIAALIWAYKVVIGGTTTLLALKEVLPFLWVWHWIFAGIHGLIVVVLILCTVAGVAFAKTGIGRAGSFLAFLTSPLWACLFFICSALYLGGVYAVNHAIIVNDGSAQVSNQTNLIVGCVLYGLALLLALRARSSSSKD
jgi:hypothetical protein